MVEHPDSKKSESGHRQVAEGFRNYHEVSAVAFEMAVPAGLGYWADTKFDTLPWLTSVGAVIGFVVGMTHLLRLTGMIGGKSAGDGRVKSGRSNNDHTTGS